MGKAIKAWRLLKRYTQEDVAGKLKVSLPTIRGYERGKHPLPLGAALELVTLYQLPSLAALLSGPPDGRDSPPNAVREPELVYDAANLNAGGLSTVCRVPIFEAIPDGWTEEALEFGGHMNLPREWVPRDGLVILRVTDSAMWPRFLPHDLILVDPHRHSRSGNVVVACYAGRKVLRSLYVSGKVRRLDPANPEYEPIVISDKAQLEILGVVIKLVDRDTV